MATDWKSLVMSDGEKLFNSTAKTDKTPMQREKIAAGIDKQIEGLKSPGTAKRAWFDIKGDIAKITVRLGTRMLAFNRGKTEAYVPSERAADAYKGLKADVLGGAFDKEIVALFDDGASGRPSASGRKRGPRGPMSPEKLEIRNAKRAATLAAKRLALEAPNTPTVKPEKVKAIAGPK